jgi:hypothetical protein
MMTTTDLPLVSVQKAGGYTGATSKKEMGTRHDALNLFKAARLRLMDVNGWTRLCGNAGIEFQVTDEAGIFLQTTAPKVGNLIRIKLPVPPNKVGDGFDWLRIEEFESSSNMLKDEERFGLRLRPVQSPAKRIGETTQSYTSTLLVLRSNSTLFAMECSRNEAANAAGLFWNRLRNKLRAIASLIGFPTPPWKMLVKGILHPPKEADLKT